MHIYTGLVWQAFQSRKTTGVMETDLLLDKAQPISNGDSAFVMTYLRKQEKLLQNSSWERSENLQTPRSEKKEGQELLQLQEQRFPCSPG